MAQNKYPQHDTIFDMDTQQLIPLFDKNVIDEHYHAMHELEFAPYSFLHNDDHQNFRTATQMTPSVILQDRNSFEGRYGYNWSYHAHHPYSSVATLSGVQQEQNWFNNYNNHDPHHFSSDQHRTEVETSSCIQQDRNSFEGQYGYNVPHPCSSVEQRTEVETSFGNQQDRNSFEGRYGYNWSYHAHYPHSSVATPFGVQQEQNWFNNYNNQGQYHDPHHFSPVQQLPEVGTSSGIQQKMPCDKHTEVDDQQIRSEQSNEKNIPESFMGVGTESLSQDSTLNELRLVNVDPKLRSCDDSQMIVQTSDRRMQEKRLFCIFCKKTYPKLARHVEHVHKDEVMVQKLKNLPKGSKERRRVLDELRKKGTFEWNTNSAINKGLLLTSRRPNQKLSKNATHYTTCANCLGTYTKNGIRQHVKLCVKNASKGERSVLLLGRVVEGRIHEKACDRLRMVIFPKLREDEIVRLIRFDWLIILYGNKLCLMHTYDYRDGMICSKLRLAGRLLSELKAICPEVTDFASLYQPKFYDFVIEAVRKVGKFIPTSYEFKSPSTAAAAMCEIKDISEMLVCEYIKRDDVEMQTKTENFQKLVKVDAPVSIYKAVLDSQARMKRLKQDRIPSTKDIKLLSDYIDRELDNYYNQLKANFSFPCWVRLSELTMAAIVVFSRKRTGETQNILISDYNNREFVDEETISTLSTEDKIFAKRYKKMKINGKRGRTVPVLIHPRIEKCIDILISNREAAKIPVKNGYLFALPFRKTLNNRVIRACKVIKDLSIECGASDPESLRGTLMRKHLASLCARRGMNDTETTYMADFMGHHDAIHREYYRRNPMVDEVVRISKILEAAKGDNNAETGALSAEAVPEHHSDNESYTDELSFGGEVILESDSEHVSYADDLRIEKEPLAKKKTQRKRWSSEEVDAARKAFEPYLQKRKLPSFEVISTQKELHGSLKGRTQQQIKAWLCNQLKKT